MNELQVYCTGLVPKIGGPEVGWKIEGNSTVRVPLHGILWAQLDIDLLFRSAN